jgi:alkylhydroperoxidase/carboxymuconolactone decarboxylase family protein YurZ
VTEQTPVLDTITAMTATAADHNTLTPRDFMFARIAAMIAVDAPPASYLANAEAAEKSGITADDIQGIMIAIAPVVGSPRVVSAAGKILRALGLAIAVGDTAALEATDEE